ncbi:MAG TPA: hypothetical protein VHC18_25320 [Amycolatopsis sp.]|nr:hypothetical protein [Amycolatopsis sp.]
MIALILAAAAGVCLAVGWLWEQAVLVYVALGASLAGLVLVLGQAWLRRRKVAKAAKAAEAAEAAEDTVDGERAVAAPPEVAPAEPEPEVEQDGEVVFVLPGRKRFHLSGCRILDGRTAEELTLAEAEEESFTACSVCAPREADELVAH